MTNNSTALANVDANGSITANNISQQHRSIEKASKTKQPFEPFGQEFSTYSQNDDFTVTTYCKWKADMDSKTLKWAFKLAETNVGPFYKTGPMGWQPKVKQSDLNKNWARYLVAIDKITKKPIAYTMFRFDMDYGCSVLYCYELQIEKAYQRKGIGRFLLTALEKLTKHYQMEKLILTVLTNNDLALEFFGKMGFETDDSSPSKSENTGYQILSKKFS